MPSLNLIPAKENSKISSIDEKNYHADKRESSSNVSSEISEKSDKKKQNPDENPIAVNDEYEDEFDVNQEGTGIHLPGYFRPNKYTQSLFEPKNFPTSVLLSDSIPIKPNDKPDYLHIRDTLENRALDWFNFINKKSSI